MKTNVSVSSILSYHDLNLGQKQYEVVKAISHLETIGTPPSCENVARYLGYEKNRVTGRIKELRDKGAITYNGYTNSMYHKEVEVYKLVRKGQELLV